MSIGHCIEFSVALSAEHDFFTNFSQRPPKSDHCVLIVGRSFLIRGHKQYCCISVLRICLYYDLVLDENELNITFLTTINQHFRDVIILCRVL